MAGPSYFCRAGLPAIASRISRCCVQLFNTMADKAFKILQIDETNRHNKKGLLSFTVPDAVFSGFEHDILSKMRLFNMKWFLCRTERTGNCGFVEIG